MNMTINVTIPCSSSHMYIDLLMLQFLARGQTLFHRTLPAPAEGPKYLIPLRNLRASLLPMTEILYFKMFKAETAGVHNSFENSNKTYTTVTSCSDSIEEAFFLPYSPPYSLLVWTRALNLRKEIEIG